MSNRGVFLDIDPAIVENNLKFTKDQNEEEFNKLFGPQGDQRPSKVIKPFPGFCIKTKVVGTDRKLFVNICHTDSIPAPKDITESELQEILTSDDSPNFRVPMSIGEPRSEPDNRGEVATVCDVAVNTKFFDKLQKLAMFKNFLLTIVFEALQNKHGLVTQDTKIILQNKKAYGTLQTHRIQQREMDEKMKETVGGDGKPLIEMLSSTETVTKCPEYKLFRRKTKPNCLIGEFKFPDILSSKDITVDLGEDRIVIESVKGNYFLDVFVPHLLRPNSATSTFNKTTRVLTATMPIRGG